MGNWLAVPLSTGLSHGGPIVAPDDNTTPKLWGVTLNAGTPPSGGKKLVFGAINLSSSQYINLLVYDEGSALWKFEAKNPQNVDGLLEFDNLTTDKMYKLQVTSSDIYQNVGDTSIDDTHGDVLFYITGLNVYA